MPDNQYQGRNIALQMVDAADQFMTGLERLIALKAMKEGAAFSWDSQELEDMIAADPALAHVSGWHLNGLHSAADAVYNAMVSGGTLTEGQDDIFQACRPGNRRSS
jgi:hypothetical protein